MKVVGIDPAIRHSGLCLLRPGAEPQFRQVNTDTNEDMVTSIRIMRTEFTRIFAPMKGKVPVLAMERQLSAGAESSASQYLAQTLLLDLALEIIEPQYVVMPLPIQLKSYARKQLGFTTATNAQIVRSFKELTGYQGRISQHKVDAWLACRLALDVLAGKWEYKLPSKDVQPIPGIITNGSIRTADRSD